MNTIYFTPVIINADTNKAFDVAITNINSFIVLDYSKAPCCAYPEKGPTATIAQYATGDTYKSNVQYEDYKVSIQVDLVLDHLRQDVTSQRCVELVPPKDKKAYFNQTTPRMGVHVCKSIKSVATRPLHKVDDAHYEVLVILRGKHVVHEGGFVIFGKGKKDIEMAQVYMEQLSLQENQTEVLDPEPELDIDDVDAKPTKQVEDDVEVPDPDTKDANASRHFPEADFPNTPARPQRVRRTKKKKTYVPKVQAQDGEVTKPQDAPEAKAAAFVKQDIAHVPPKKAPENGKHLNGEQVIRLMEKEGASGIQKAIQNGSVNVQHKYEMDLLSCAVYLNDVEILDVLLKAGMQPSQTALWTAIRVQANKLALKMVDYGADFWQPIATNNGHKFAIEVVFEHNNYEFLHMLLRKYPEYTKKMMSNGFMLIHEAIRHKSTRAVEIILEVDPSSAKAMADDGRIPVEMLPNLYSGDWDQWRDYAAIRRMLLKKFT